MKNLAFSYKDNNVRINCVAPGAILSEITESTMRMFPNYKFEYGMSPAGMALYVQKGIGILNPRENLGHSQDIAEAIAFLSSQQAKFINGASLLVDGGWYTA
jgi:NAD(P)-dependent dehydrogenase (short-subunit alcohol dehydrogenase family)